MSSHHHLSTVPHRGDAVLVVEVHGEELVVEPPRVHCLLHVLAQVQHPQQSLQKYFNRNKNILLH